MRCMVMGLAPLCFSVTRDDGAFGSRNPAAREGAPMGHYYVNDNVKVNADHEVHRLGCTCLSHEESRTYLGQYHSCTVALQAARQYFSHASRCPYCSREHCTD